ncbi:hypothetical protein Ahy_A07g032660 [Arachis hypogaea]|uniref:Aminotransferase-like plant mobile domain-containing protein n=1 Tax=Arachis hypogaea TaxID=3818 RepID=A0A445C7B5_ARAHY|nr:hypothetical protein Ahy_A07g032660 [Arachis hypogaea]
MILISFFYKKIKDLRCSTRLLNEKFQHMSEEKKAIVRELGFDGLMHIPPMYLPHKLLKELAYSFNVVRNRLDIQYSELTINPENIRAALGLNAFEVFRRFQDKTLKNLTDEMMDIGVDTDEDRLIFKRIFIIYIQMAFLLPTMINKVSPVHMHPIFYLDNIREWNWGSHVLEFIIKGIREPHLKKKIH